jgi:hypothetical protein
MSDGGPWPELQGGDLPESFEPRQHPLDFVLADYSDGLLQEPEQSQVADHVAGCVLCSSIVAGTAPAEGAFNTRGWKTPQELLASQARFPEFVTHALQDAVVTAPAPGQLWILRSDEVSHLAVIAAVDEDVAVLPVTADEQGATDVWTAQLALVPGRSAGGHETVDQGPVLACWTSLEAIVGVEVLDVYLGDVDADALARVRRAYRRGQQPPTDLALGRVVTGDEPGVAELRSYRRDLASTFGRLSDARLDADITDIAGIADGAVALDLAVALQGLTPTTLAAVLDEPVGRAREVLEGRQPSTDELTRIAAHVGAASVSGGHAPPERPWVRALGSPARRRRFAAVAATHGRSEWEQRREAAWSEPIAARHNRGAEADWEALAEAKLRELEHDAGLR